jgi:hypothetical protein
MKWAHCFCVVCVFLLAWAVALVLARDSGVSVSVLLADLAQMVVWLVAGGIATLSAVHEARQGRSASVVKSSR